MTRNDTTTLKGDGEIENASQRNFCNTQMHSPSQINLKPTQQLSVSFADAANDSKHISPKANAQNLYAKTQPSTHQKPKKQQQQSSSSNLKKLNINVETSNLRLT